MSRGEEGLSTACGWVAEAGHLLALLDDAFPGYLVGIWLKNVRTAGKAQWIEQRVPRASPVGWNGNGSSTLSGSA
ncbi:hypothetical protein [Streptomyces sp. NPDC005731]|uniref:hypothetical protein n=1 Tax=Streptomyces sp. NPDC005731 TaxID=3157056 RepID=UPI0033D20EA1